MISETESFMMIYVFFILSFCYNQVTNFSSELSRHHDRNDENEYRHKIGPSYFPLAASRKDLNERFLIPNSSSVVSV